MTTTRRPAPLWRNASNNESTGGPVQVVDKGKRYRLRYWSTVDGIYKEML
jgi:hypothetical protein